MSADNYYTIRPHPLGGYALVMAFDSDWQHEDWKVNPEAPQFDTIADAEDEFWAHHDTTYWSEYGLLWTVNFNDEEEN